MSALSGSSQPLAGWPRPRLSRLFGAVLGGELLAAVTLWILCIALAFAGLAPFGGDGKQEWVWLPWQIDGAWALVGAIGWGYVVCALVAALVRDGIVRCGYAPPAVAWLRISVAISGYGAMAVGDTAAAHIVVAVLGGAIVIRLVTFKRDGSARGWRWSLTRREGAVTIVLAALIGLSYSGLHPFAADGGGGTFTSATVIAHGSETGQVDIGFNTIHVPVRITGARLTGAGASHFRVESIAITDNGNPADSPGRSGPISYRVPAGDQTWITATIEASCADLSISTLELRYTILGINTSERIPLSQPLNMICR